MNKYILPAFLLSLVACNETNSTQNSIDENEFEIQNSISYYGNTQGTTYAVLCNDKIELTHNEIDVTLKGFDSYLSSYIPESVLSRLNDAEPGVFIYTDSLNYFNRCLKQSQYIYDLSDGAFDPSVYPLVDGWGFMKDIENVPDSTTIDSLRSLIGFQNGYHFSFFPSLSDSTIEESKIIKNTPHTKLDFNAIAQGLSVDVLCELLESKGAKNYMVEVGGEFRMKGLNSDGVLWRIGIDKPIEKSTALTRELQEVIQVDDKAVATSGSYRKFYEKNGIKYSHTLDTKTGYPVTHSLLSATVVAPNCALADGLATAFMVMGPKKSISFMKNTKLKDVELYLIFINSKGRMETYYTKGFKSLIVE